MACIQILAKLQCTKNVTSTVCCGWLQLLGYLERVVFPSKACLLVQDLRVDPFHLRQKGATEKVLEHQMCSSAHTCIVERTPFTALAKKDFY